MKITHTLPRRRLAVAAALALAVTLLWPSASSTVSAAPVSPSDTIQGHHCNSMGVVNGFEGVHCADLVFVPMASGNEVWAIGQALCRVAGGGPGTTRQCAGIRQNVGVYMSGRTGPVTIRQVNCGVWGGSACPATTRFSNESGHVTIPPRMGCVEVWAAMTDDLINLPGNIVTGPGPNVASSPHAKFCS